MNNKVNPRLLCWYISIDERKKHAHGNIIFSRKFPNFLRVKTSAIKNININTYTGFVEIKTRNTTYLCDITDLDFDKQDSYPDALDDYDDLKKKFKDK